MLIAYALREEYAGTVEQTDLDGNTSTVPLFLGGILHLGDDRDLNVRDALDENGGHIVATDTAQTAVAALDAYLPLKRVRVPAGALPIITPYDDVDLATLRSIAASRGIGKAANASRVNLALALNGHDEALAAGGLDTPPTVSSLARSFTEEHKAKAPADGDEQDDATGDEQDGSGAAADENGTAEGSDPGTASTGQEG